MADNEKAPKTNGDKGQLKAKFQKYQSAHDAVEKAREALENALAARTVTVETIIEDHGKGPFKWQGMMLQGVIRKNEEAGTRTAFFKNLAQNEVQEV